MERYSVVVESGSCSQDYQKWEERAHCGHAHRTIETATACLAKLTRRYCQHGRPQGTSCRHCLGRAQGSSMSAQWFGATLHNQDGERVVWWVSKSPRSALRGYEQIFRGQGRKA